MSKSKGNKFANDGSFMEMFQKEMEKRKQQETDQTSPTPLESARTTFEVAPPPVSSKSTATSSESDEKSEMTPATSSATQKFSLPLVGKRRGGSSRTLKTGIVVKKQKNDEIDDQKEGKGDAWSQYLAEVDKYKSKMCVDEDQSRPLVK